MTVIFAVITVALWVSPVPGVIAFFFSLFAVLPALSLKSHWSGGGGRVYVDAGHIVVDRVDQTSRRVALGDVQSVESRKSVGAGTQQFFVITAVCRPSQERRLPRRFEIATMVRGDEAADEVVAWLEERLTRW